MSSSVSGSRSSSISHYPYPAYYQDAVRVVVQQICPASSPKEEEAGSKENDPMTSSTSSISSATGGANNSRRFSVDPSLTNFDILRNLIGRAFDMKGDFAISYRAYDDLGAETYLPLVSDWDLSAAFLSASEPDLQLIIEPKNIPVDVDDDEPWDVVKSTEVLSDANSSQRFTQRNPSSSSSSSVMQYHHPQSNGNNALHSSTSSSSSSKVWSQLNQYPLGLNSKINTAGIFNTMEKWVQKAKTFVDDLSLVTSRPPLSDVEFRNYLDPGGVLCRPRELRYACYHGGIEAGLRKVVWKHLLNIYPDALSGNARMDYVRNKSKEYFELRDAWKNTVANLNEDILCVSNMVRKDVLRTDRHLQFFADSQINQDDNQNITQLFNILTTYALNHPSVGYCQGMSDLASPLLVTMGDEAQAYICFCALMDRIKPNFNCDGLAMSLKFAHLSEALAYYDLPFWEYLKTIGADDLLFCYRWLLLEMKREFAFEDALRMMEVLWASLPYKPQDVPLFETKFTPSNANSIPIPVPTLSASYTRVCAIRRSSTSVGNHPTSYAHSADLRGRRLSRKPKPNPLSLDESSLTSMSSIGSSTGTSTGTINYRSHTKPFYSLDETMETSGDFSNSPFEILSLTNPGTPSAKPRLIKNLKEFWTIGGSKSCDNDESEDSTPFSSKSSTMSNFQVVNQSQQNQPEVFFDDPDAELDLMLSTHSLPTRSRSRHSSSDSVKLQLQRQLKRNASTSASSLTVDNTNVNNKESMNLKNDKSDPDRDNNSTFLHLKQEIDHHDPERRSQNSTTGDSEHDSGHCYGDSIELFDSSLQEPEFSSTSTSGTSVRSVAKMPSPDIFGGGNPFLMFLCLTLLLQHRNQIMSSQLDYNETAMFFDKMIRKHNVGRVLAHARMLYAEYMKQNCTRA